MLVMLSPMKVETPVITEVHTHLLRAPLAQTIYTAFGRMDVRNCVLVSVHTDAGLVGLGESWVNYPSWAPVERIATILEGFRPLLIGQRLTHPRDLWQRCFQTMRLLALQWGAIGPIYQALSGIDIALWDLYGKLHQAPIWQLLGASHQETALAYASGLAQRRQSDLGSYAAQLISSGYPAVKVKLGFGRDIDEQNLRDVHAALAGKPLLVDANQGWSLPETRAMLPLLHSLNVLWLEEPLPADELHQWRQLRQDTPMRLAAGENLYGLHQFQEWSEGLLDVIQPDICKCGGFTAFMDIMQAASAAGKLLAPHYFGGAVGLAATLHAYAALSAQQRFYVEYDVTPNPLRDELLTTPLLLQPGLLRIPQEPGLGITLDRQTLNRCADHPPEYY